MKVSFVISILSVGLAVQACDHYKICTCTNEDGSRNDDLTATVRASSITISGLLGLGATATSFTSTGTPDGGFSIPDDIPDGVYSVSYDDSGLAVHTAIEDLEVRDIGAVPSIETRDGAGGATLGKRD
ncbi:hypothetical protein GCG54_00013949 [Colletotrichum gloeosporioides]|uniref:Carboxypeptidase regulatory-like domain-containing protein n=1 Tax=Colletotrichum gloeosporioides TaxID=474922 RepID=A0A8H4FHX6_COLGL|nr:uncharacterized protein GCG54_00013949 [Colletotrichum gloeosporioides]KAF3802715.1 hypothetical protein GCG54_00013949 [Colletotrichum gloeosporioides]